MQWVPVPPGRLVLQTLRSHDQYNTTIYGLDDRYRGVKGGRRVVFVNPADIAALGLTAGDRVDLVSEFAEPPAACRSAAPRTSSSYRTPPRSATPPPTTRRPTPWFHWTMLQPSRIHRCRRRSSSDSRLEPRPCGTGDLEAAREPPGRRHVTERPETLVVEEPLEIRVNGVTADGDHADPRLGCRTGTGFPADRGSDRPPRRRADGAVLPGRGRDAASTPTTSST